jgi:hypothetical protein
MKRLDEIKDIDERAHISAKLIKDRDLKNRRKFPYIPTKVIDNFFEAPAGWRAFALDQEYHRSQDGTWPGERTKTLNELDPEMFEIFAKKILENSPDFVGFTNLVAQFHLIDETFGKGWVHDDDPLLNLVGVVYLNKNAPLDTGTTLYKDKYDKSADQYREYFKQDVLVASAEGRKKLAKIRDEHRSKFTPNLKIENVFNRCVIYDPRTWHSPDNFFGTTRETSRLNLVFFAQGVKK